jgi:hypothetical protein
MPSRIGPEGLRQTDKRRILGMLGFERVEPTVEVDVVSDQHAAGMQCTPRVTELKEQVALGVSAVVHEKVDSSDLIQNAAQTASTRSWYVRPARPETLRYGSGDLGMEVPMQRRR